MNNAPTIRLAHGGGGRLARDWIRDAILTRFGDGALRALPDAATLALGEREIVFSTDSFVVSPLCFPGGNIGSLAVHGSVNDVAVAGGRPRWLSLALVIGEGLPLATLDTILDAVRAAAAAAQVEVVTGDTKVIERGPDELLIVNTAAIGERLPEYAFDARRIEPGDRILCSGTLGDHGMAVMAARHGLAAAGGPVSDSAPVYPLVHAARGAGTAVRFMRDPTRGGAAAVLNEIVEDRNDIGILLDEPSLPLDPRVTAVADIFGIDPLYSACEGRVLAVCAPAAAEAVLKTWRSMPAGRHAAIIGQITAEPACRGMVAAQTLTGGRRIVDVPRGELLPRIC